MHKSIRVSLVGVVLAASILGRLDAGDDKLKQALKAWFSKPSDKRTDADLVAAVDYAKLAPKEKLDIRKLVVEAYRATKAKAHAADHEAGIVRWHDTTMKYTLERRGAKPKRGWPVFIFLHGGGGNRFDLLWERAKRYYRTNDCLHVCPRSPADTRESFRSPEGFALLAELIREVALFEDVDTNRIYLHGYSAGGYSAFSIGTAYADRLAGVYVSDGAPPDEEATAVENLMNTKFIVTIGEQDENAKSVHAFVDPVKTLRSASSPYPVEARFISGAGHGESDDDANAAAKLEKSVRPPAPTALRWCTGSNSRTFSWLEIEKPIPHGDISASCAKNQVELKVKGLDALTVDLDDRLVDESKPVTVVANGKQVFSGTVTPRLATLCRTIDERGDPELMFDVEIPVALK